MTLADLFPDEDCQFKLRFERGDPAEFFGPTNRHADLVAQRRHWLQTAPQTHAALLPEGIPLLEETIALAKSLETLPDDPPALRSGGGSPWERCLALGQCWEPDYLLLKPGSDGRFHLLGACVCFPSSWSLAEKIGRPLEFIHSVVPDLNEALGNPIHGFLSKLRPGLAWQRYNWGLSRSSELNQHPERALPRLDANVRLDEVWLRLEHQALVALPENQAVLFGIRLVIHPLAEIKKDAAVAKGLRRTLTTMPEAMASYKNLAAARARIIALLQS